MMNRILFLVISSIFGFVIGYAWDSALPIKEKAPPKWIRVGLWWLIYIVDCGIALFVKSSSFLINFIVVFFSIVVVFVGFHFFYGGSHTGRKVTSLFFCGMVMFWGILVNSIIMPVFNLPDLSLNYTSRKMLIAPFSCCIASYCLVHDSIGLWRNFKKKKRTVPNMLVFVYMHICTAFSISVFAVDVYIDGSEISILNVFLIMFAYILAMLLMFIPMYLSRKDEFEKGFNELKHITELDHQHYESVELRREEMAKIRHDYNNILSSVLALLHMNKIPEAEETVKNLLIKIEQTREMEYCEIPIVNAILSEKEAECRRNNIKLSVDLLFPADISVSYIDLCSVFSNLLDNAIRACNHFTQEENKRIDLTVRTQGGYILVRCDNPSLKAPGAQPEGTGYGMKILNDIAKRYGGEFKSSFKDGVFTARLVMLAE